MTGRRLAWSAAGLVAALGLIAMLSSLRPSAPGVAPGPPAATVALAAPAPASGAAAAAASASGAAPAAAAAETTPPATISVQGEGVVTTTPDVVQLVMGVQVTNRSLAQAEADAASRMNAVIDKLTSMGIARDDIKTVSYNVNPQYDYPQDGGAPILRGFEVSNLVSVKIKDINRAGEIIDAVIAVGATTIQGLSFDVDNPAAANDQARSQAMQDAQHKAQQLAAAAGVSLGRPLSISETSTTSPPPVPLARGVAAAPAAAAPPPIQPGTTEIHVQVSVTYAIQ